jgi:hypothetical protein
LGSGRHCDDNQKRRIDSVEDLSRPRVGGSQPTMNLVEGIERGEEREQNNTNTALTITINVL